MSVSRAALIFVVFLGCLLLGSCASGDKEALVEPCTVEGKNPVITYWAVPEYPQEAADAGLEASVLVKVLILADGTVGEALILQSSGYPILDEAALAATRRCVFEPGERYCIPVKSWMALPFEFPPAGAETGA